MLTKAIESFQTLEAKKISEINLCFILYKASSFAMSNLDGRYSLQLQGMNSTIRSYETNRTQFLVHKIKNNGNSIKMVVKNQHKSCMWYQDRQITKLFQLTDSRKPKGDLECHILYRVMNMQYNTSRWHSLYIKWFGFKLMKGMTA